MSIIKQTSTSPMLIDQSHVGRRLRHLGVIGAWHISMCIKYLENKGFAQASSDQAFEDSIGEYADAAKRQIQEMRDSGGKELFLKAIYD